MTVPTSPAHQFTGVVGAVADLLAALEAEHHAVGWDNSPATLYGVLRHADGRLSRQTVPLGSYGEHPRDELAVIAEVFELHQFGSAMQQVLPAAPIGWLLVMEAWMQAPEGETREQTEERIGGRQLADVVGSIEIRLGVGVVGSHRLVLLRRRGHDAEWPAPGVGVNEWSGGMFENLVKIQAAARAGA